MFAITGIVVGPAFASRAQVCLAPSIWRRLLMQALCWALRRARTKLGMAMVASRPMMATTIMISTSVKPAERGVLVVIVCIFLLSLPRRELAAGGFIIIFQLLFGIACDPPRLGLGLS